MAFTRNQKCFWRFQWNATWGTRNWIWREKRCNRLQGRQIGGKSWEPLTLLYFANIAKIIGNTVRSLSLSQETNWGKKLPSKLFNYDNKCIALTISVTKRENRQNSCRVCINLIPRHLGSPELRQNQTDKSGLVVKKIEKAVKFFSWAFICPLENIRVNIIFSEQS